MSEHVNNLTAKLSDDIKATAQAAQAIGGRCGLRQVAACIEAELAAIRDELQRGRAKTGGAK